ncbi:MAG: histidine phosphatase family protein [Anaerovoracaceae bacterium]|jgi:alpha-ribazole phosphatase
MGSYIHIIRHGLTEGNIKKLFYGTRDLPLAPEGRRQLEDLISEDIYPRPENPDYYATDLIRSQQTLEMIYGKQDFRLLNGLKEIDCGEYEMKTAEELEKEPEFRRWVEDNGSDVRPPGGESVKEFRQRVRSQFKELTGLHRLKDMSVRHNKKDANSIVVCHGGAIGAIMFDCFPGLHDDLWHWIPPTGRGYTLIMDHGEVIDYCPI